MTELPAYAELPELGELGVRHSWGLLPPDAGTLSFVSGEAVAAAAALVTSGEPVSLNLALTAFDPPLFGRDALVHRMVIATRNDVEEVIDAFNPQASSQIDGLAHVRAREFGFYGGITDLDAARAASGIHHWAERGIAARGILLDVPRSRVLDPVRDDPFAGVSITPADLEAVAREHGVRFEPGDVVLVRTGWAGAFLALTAERRDGVRDWDGLSADASMAEFLWDNRVAIVGGDTPAVEVAPGDPAIGSLHRRLLPGLGMPLMELLALDRLAERCAELGRWEFLFMAAPMNLEGAVSSPANAIALL